MKKKKSRMLLAKMNALWSAGQRQLPSGKHLINMCIKFVVPWWCGVSLRESVKSYAYRNP